MNDVFYAFQRVTMLPFFWSSMAIVFIMAMFCGGLVYNGDVPHAKKGVMAVGSYIFMIILVMGQYVAHWYGLINSNLKYQLFVYPVQLLLLSVFWLMGFTWAIFVVRCCRRRHRYETKITRKIRSA